MSWVMLKENRERVLAALRQGYVDEVTLCTVNVFDRLAAALYELGYWKHLELIKIKLEKDQDDVPNELLLRELAVLPLLRIPNPHQAPTFLFQDHGVLRFLGFTARQIREGFNHKGVKGGPETKRMLPHHRDDFYNAIKAVDLESLEDFRRAHIRSLWKHRLLRGGVYGLDGTGISGTGEKLVMLQQLPPASPFVVNWGIQGPGSEIPLGRELVEEWLEITNGEGISLLLMDGGFVDGEWIASLWLRGVDCMIRVHEDMEIFKEMKGLSQMSESSFQTYRYVAYINGHKEVREVELALIEGLKEWDSFRRVVEKVPKRDPDAVGTGKGDEWPGFWGLLIRQKTEEGEKEWGIVSTKIIKSRESGFEEWRQRWGVENNGFRELNQGAWLEKETWGRSEEAIKLSIYLKIGAHNGYCLLNTKLGERLAAKGFRDLQRLLRSEPPKVLVVVEGEYALLTIEEIVGLLGVKIKESFLPKSRWPS